MQILFALLVGFIAVEVWSNFDKAKVASEASALRAVVLLVGTFPNRDRAATGRTTGRHRLQLGTKQSGQHEVSYFRFWVKGGQDVNGGAPQ